ncbi:hypothetical protein JCM17844_26100 [Iodidimonas gelatinilytica]|uniref:Uncharacterized protein n=1 Tax=Iodidimonas gelatinilytica TaxID=1236966 RepID=A0A5A7MUH6_9PROT|nr:hypothetical protein [Iodidimonas gelatinilytica]GEQ98973.1 hypothetical protein JCM17844_26100 [Iodidimonas gelatinilytica]
MTLRQSLNHLFRPALEALHEDGRVTALQSGGFFGGSVLVLPRAWCRHQFFPGDFQNTKALQALQLKVQFNTPFKNPGLYLRAGTSGAGVWTWDQDTVFAHIPPKSGKRLIPESALFPAINAPDSQIRRLACLSGVEGQIWKDGSLKTSRWWAQEPNARDWQAFLKAGRLSPDNLEQPVKTTKAEITTPPFIDGPLLPWLKKSITANLVPIVLLLFLAPFTYQLTQWGAALWMERHYQAQTAQKRQSAQPLLADRRDALSAIGSINTAMSLGDESLLLHALMEWVRVLDGFELEISRLQFSDNKLAVYASGEGQSKAPQIVEALENSPVWSDVSLQPSTGNTVIVRGTLHAFTSPEMAPPQSAADSDQGS